MSALIPLVVVVAVSWAYLAGLTTWALFRDDTLTGTGRFARVVLAWLFPLVAPLFMLRAIAEVSPLALPPPAFLRPVIWLLRIRARSGDNFSSADGSIDDGWSGLGSSHDQGHH